MSTQKKTMLSAVTPSNRVTLGNWIGAIRNWVNLQDGYDCVFFSTDLHAITVRQDPKQLHDLTLQALAQYIAAGIDPNKALLFIQSHVPQHAELTWILNCYTYMGELNRMTQFKDKSSKQGANIGAGLFTYPVLMAADILLYQTHLVPVGEDQKQHVEITRDIAIRLRNLYGEDLFTIPEPWIPPVGARIMSLQNPDAKMSKSDADPNATIFLDESNDSIVKKLKRAMTDSGSEITYDPAKPGVKNLLDIQGAMTGKKPQDIAASYAGKMYGHLKVDTADLVVQAVGPIRDKAAALLKDRAHLEQVLRKGAETARERAEPTLQKLKERVGFIPRF